MDSQKNQNWQRKLEEMEVEINPTPISEENSHQSYPYQAQIRGLLMKLHQWFNQLPIVGKIVIGVGTLMMGFSVLNMVFKLVTALISLSILGLFLYLVYKSFIASTPSK